MYDVLYILISCSDLSNDAVERSNTLKEYSTVKYIRRCFKKMVVNR